MESEAIVTVSATVVALVQLAKWAGLSGERAPWGVALLSALGVGVWAYSEGDPAQASAFGYLTAFAAVMTSAAGVFGFTRASADSLVRMRNVAAVTLAVGLGATLAGCGAKLPPIQPLPAAVEVVDEDVKAFAARGAEILELSSAVALDASNVYVRLRDAGAVPQPLQDHISAGFRKYTASVRRAQDEIERGAIDSWPKLKGVIDPVAVDLQQLIDDVRGAGPSVWSRIGRGLMTALSLVLAAMPTGAVGA